MHTDRTTLGLGETTKLNNNDDFIFQFSWLSELIVSLMVHIIEVL